MIIKYGEINNNHSNRIWDGEEVGNSVTLKSKSKSILLTLVSFRSNIPAALHLTLAHDTLVPAY